MSFPLYAHELFGEAWGLVAGTLIGFGFGFVLERAGFGRARNLAAQFYLTDTRVLKVMFSGIVTAMVGMALLSGVGLLDVSLLTVPETFLWPQLVGGLLLGAGFIVSGYCPGTAAVGAASGNVDALLSLLGVMAGSLAFGFAYGPLEGFYLSGGMGVVTLHGLLGVPMPVLALGVVAMAIGAFLAGEALERAFTKKAGEGAPPSPKHVKVRVFAGLAAAAALGVATLALPARAPATPPREVATVDAVALAKRIVAQPEGLWLVDLRPAAAAEKGRIPGAMALPADDPKAAFVAGLSPTRTLVVYAEKEPASLPEGLKAYAGEVAVLSGGYEAWSARVLSPPVPPESPTPALVAEFRMQSALHSRFTGAAAAEAPKLVVKPVSASSAAPKKGGGC